VKYITLLLLGSFGIWAATPPAVVVHSAKDLSAATAKLAAKKSRFAGEDLERYPHHYTMLAERDATGSSEVHDHEADIFFVLSGEATLLTGGKLVNPHTTKPGEIRGTSIRGGERRQVGAGDVIQIAAGIPHQLLVTSGKPFSYYVVKVTGQ
jgi:mannose-6-phosphate isomerase-like protein (cupin superfamily)